MISGFSPETPVETTRASGVMPSASARVSLITTTADAPSFSGHALPAVTEPFGPEHRLELRELLDGGAVARAVVLRDHGAVGQRDRGDLPLEEPVLLRLDGPLL